MKTYSKSEQKLVDDGYTLEELVMTPNDFGTPTGGRWLVAVYGFRGDSGVPKPIATCYMGQDKAMAERAFEHAKNTYPNIPAKRWYPEV